MYKHFVHRNPFPSYKSLALHLGQMGDVVFFLFSLHKPFLESIHQSLQHLR